MIQARSFFYTLFRLEHRPTRSLAILKQQLFFSIQLRAQNHFFLLENRIHFMCINVSILLNKIIRTYEN